jgi:beta-xylosidase
MDYSGPTIKTNTLPHQTCAWFLNLGVTVYSSTDLVHWTHEASQLSGFDYQAGSIQQPTNLLFRPKVIKNDRTGKYILMAGITSPDFEAFNDVVYAVADGPQGPFSFQGKLPWCGKPGTTDLWMGPWAPGTGDDTFSWNGKYGPVGYSSSPQRIRAFDTTLFKDDDGSAYLLAAHSRILLYKLSSDYTCAEGVEVMQGAEGEAPAVFKDRNTYYLLSSRLACWLPNQNTYFSAPSIHGPWAPRGAFASGPGEKTTFDSQTTFVLPVQGKQRGYIFMADRFGATSMSDVPDLGNATHIWLPIEIDRGAHTLSVPWRASWDASDLTGILQP